MDFFQKIFLENKHKNELNMYQRTSISKTLNILYLKYLNSKLVSQRERERKIERQHECMVMQLTSLWNSGTATTAVFRKWNTLPSRASSMTNSSSSQIPFTPKCRNKCHHITHSHSPFIPRQKKVSVLNKHTKLFLYSIPQ